MVTFPYQLLAAFNFLSIGFAKNPTDGRTLCNRRILKFEAVFRSVLVEFLCELRTYCVV